MWHCDIVIQWRYLTLMACTWILVYWLYVHTCLHETSQQQGDVLLPSTSSVFPECFYRRILVDALAPLVYKVRDHVNDSMCINYQEWLYSYYYLCYLGWMLIIILMSISTLFKVLCAFHNYKILYTLSMSCNIRMQYIPRWKALRCWLISCYD